MQITGTIQTIIYRNADNGWTVLELTAENGERLSAVGTLPLCAVGERVELEGAFVTHPRYGRQFKASSAKTLAPATLAAIEGYLGSGVIKGVGASTAHAIVAHFGMDTFSVLDEQPERLTEIPGIGKKRGALIAASYRDNRQMRDVMLALEPYGVTVNQAWKLYRIYGEGCIARIEENPYQIIADVDGIGFVTADRIAQNVSGFSFDSPARLRAGLLYALAQGCGEYGHTYLPRASLLDYAQRLLGVGQGALADALDEMIGAREVVYQMVGDVDGVFQPRLCAMENEIAARLIKLAALPEVNPFLEAAAAAPRGSIRLAPQQAEAVRLAMTQGVLVVTGGPGTGKTTIIRCITEILTDMQMEFALTAPTGRAAKRMSEATGCEARTLHRLLEYVPGEGFKRNADDPLLYDMIIVDEASMVDVPLLHALLAAIPAGTRLIMVGDSDQLPSVGPGDALRDIIASGVVRVVRLTEIFRQAQQSLIVTNAHRINAGRMPLLDNSAQSDFRFEEYQSQEQALERVLGLCAHPDASLPVGEPLMDIQVLAPMKKGPLGVYNLNARLQAALNPPSPDKAEHAFGERILRVGDKVMQVQNNYKVEWTRRGPNGASIEGAGAFNGDLGTVYRIDNGARRFSILFDDDRLAHYEFTQSDEIELAYCISIHKSQGSEFPVVILPLCGGPPVLLTRNLLYTALTRARRQVVCLGRRETVAAMVQNNRDMRRYTALAVRLREWQALQR